VEKKYSGRKLKIKGYGFETHIEPLDLKAKVPVGLLVIDLDSDVGVGCYFEHLNEGNKFFKNTQYADAKSEYFLALLCSDMPEDNDLSKKIEDAGTALDCKYAADNYYNEGKYIEAKQEYEKLRGLNPNDSYTAERITACDIRIPNLPRTIRMKVTDTNGKLMPDVEISAESYKVNGKTGDIVRDKNGKPKGSFKVLSTTTNQQGECVITVKMENKILKLKKYKDSDTEYFAQIQIPATTDYIEVNLNERATTKAIINTLKDGIIDVAGSLQKK
jgi:tetratricopeptide (TPR) repeat protein